MIPPEMRPHGDLRDKLGLRPGDTVGELYPQGIPVVIRRLEGVSP